MSDAFLASRKWPPSADVRRLDAAFADLEANRILAIHNGPCCDTCLGGYLWGEAVPAAKEAGRELQGYVFYNEQTSQSVIEGGELFLVCGPIPEPTGREFRPAAKRVTGQVKRQLIAHGLTVKHTPTEYVLRVSLGLNDGEAAAD
jgi:Domain of unknown function (DUF6891)